MVKKRTGSLYAQLQLLKPSVTVGISVSLCPNKQRTETFGHGNGFLKETGVGKTVNSLRKHELVGDFARDLVDRWKKLVPVSQEPDSYAFRTHKHGKKDKDWDCERSNWETAKLSLETSKRKRKFSDVDQNSVGFSCNFEEEEKEEEFEPPTMSFEEYLTYDQPQKKKKKVVKHSVPAGEKDQGHSKKNTSKAHTNTSSSSAKSPSRKRTSEKRAEKEPPEAPEPKRIILDVVPTLPDIPLPPIQANYRPLPSIDSITCSQTKRKAVSSPVEESEAGFGVCRLYSKTPVFSGRVREPMSASQQSIRGLGNNIDSISEEASVPFSVLEPVLERGTPEQLYRIEECSHVLIGHTDNLWQKRCLREFKNERPGQSESWREMYMRLHDAREQRLLTLARDIGSAQTNKAKG
ncbi:elongin-A-like, partial [Pluvialis apricaria]